MKYVQLRKQNPHDSSEKGKTAMLSFVTLAAFSADTYPDNCVRLQLMWLEVPVER